MRVFITGGSGWVGSGIIRELLATGHTVTALARSPEAAALYRIAMERLAAGTLPAGSVLHAVADQGVPFRELAGAIAHRLALGPPAPRKSKHFGSFAMFAGIDNPASSDITQQLTGWRPTHPPLLDDIRGSAYAPPSPPP
jgi:NAD(P)-dependent dehydrogenase (short-subunit alcohol dehydrogenase family)